MALNVPYQDTQPTLSLADSVGKWTQINNQQAAGKLAQQQEQRLQQQNERENKMGELKFGIKQRDALKSVATDYKAALQRKSGELGIKPGTPEYQQLANAMYANNYGQIFTNITGKTHNPGENIDLNALDALAGMTPAEQAQAELQVKKAELDLAQPYKIEIAQAQAGIAQAQQERGFDNQQRMKMYDYQHDDFIQERKHKWDEEADFRKQKLTQSKPLPVAALKLAQADIQTINDANTAVSEVSGLLKNINSGVLKTDLYTKAKAGVLGALDMADKETEALAEFETKRQGLANKLLLLAKGVQTDGDALRADIENFKNATDTKVAKNMLENIKAKFEREAMLRGHNVESIYEQYGKDAPDLSYSVDKNNTLTHDFSSKRQPPQMPEGADPQAWQQYINKYYGGGK